MKNTTYEF